MTRLTVRVCQDIGIATFLILLWKHTYDAIETSGAAAEDEPWKAWPRPPAGFLDLGYFLVRVSPDSMVLTDLLPTDAGTDSSRISSQQRDTLATV